MADRRAVKAQHRMSLETHLCVNETLAQGRAVNSQDRSKVAFSWWRLSLCSSVSASMATGLLPARTIRLAG